MKSNIESYLSGCTNKTRILLYLLSTGELSFSQIRKLKVKELREYLQREGMLSKNEKFILLCDDLIFLKNMNDTVFTNPSGRLMSEKDIQNTLIRACERAGSRYTGHREFVSIIRY